MKEKIKEYAKSKNVKLWQIADVLGLHDTNFSKKLRHPLSEEEEKKIICIIDSIADTQKKGGSIHE